MRARVLPCLVMLVAAPLWVRPASGSTAAMEATAAAIRWVPAEAQHLLHVRFSDLNRSALFRELMESRPLFDGEMAHILHLVERARLRLARDVDWALIATDGREGGESVAIVGGRFDPRGLRARLAEAGATTVRRQAGVITLLPGPQAGEKTPPGRATAVAFPRSSLALIGTRDWVERAVDRSEGNDPRPAGNGGPASLLRRMDRSATLWSAASRLAASEKVRSHWDSGLFEPPDLGAVQHVISRVRITSEIRIDSETAVQTSRDAMVLAFALRGLITAAGLRAALTDPELAEVLREVSVERTGQGVRLAARIPGALAARF